MTVACEINVIYTQQMAFSQLRSRCVYLLFSKQKVPPWLKRVLVLVEDSSGHVRRRETFQQWSHFCHHCLEDAPVILNQVFKGPQVGEKRSKVMLHST